MNVSTWLASHRQFRYRTITTDNDRSKLPDSIEIKPLCVLQRALLFHSHAIRNEECVTNVSWKVGVLLRKVEWNFSFVYLEDIVIFLHWSDDHVNHFCQFFTIIYDAGVTLNLKKCKCLYKLHWLMRSCHSLWALQSFDTND